MPCHDVSAAADILTGRLTPVRIGRVPVVLTRLPSGEIRALLGRCPHRGAPLEYGCVSGLTTSDEPNRLAVERAGEILRCPWHGFEFDLSSGLACVQSPGRATMRLRFFDVKTEDGRVVVQT